MISWATRTTVRFCSGTSCAVKHRVESIPLVFHRASACYSTEISLDSTPHSQPTIATPSTQRTYATKPVSRPKGHTGRTTTSPRKKKPKAVVESADASTGEKAKKTTTTKPKAKSKATRKPKAKPKVKADPAKKASAKKPAKKRVKKPLTEDQKKKKQLRTLKKLALKPPKNLPSTAWQVLHSEVSKQSPGNVTTTAKESSTKYKSLLPEELEHYNHLANVNERQNKEAFNQWINTFTPAEIDTANKARGKLRRLGVSILKLQDSRHNKRPSRPSAFFLRDRMASGDYKGMKINDAFILVMNEFKNLSAEDKQKYQELGVQDKARYEREKSAEATPA